MTLSRRRFTLPPLCRLKPHCYRRCKKCTKALVDKATEWDKVIKIGRTHLMDATPLRLGQEFGGFARQLELSIARAKAARDAVLELPVGGTAVGSGINTHPEFGARVASVLAEQTGIRFVEADNHFEANAQRDALVQSHGELNALHKLYSTSRTTFAGWAVVRDVGFLRGQTADSATRQFDHAGQSQSGDV